VIGRSRRDRNGQSLVEFALLLPVLLLIIFGVVDFGRGIFQYNTTAEAARQAGRLAVVDQTVAAVKAQARTSAVAVALDADPNGVRVCFKDAAMSTAAQLSCTNTAAATLCNGGVAPKFIGCLAVVETQSKFLPLTPVISRIIGNLTLTSRSVNPIEYVCDTPTQAACP
jgi:Flp pilus assembly protein TadG